MTAQIKKESIFSLKNVVVFTIITFYLAFVAIPIVIAFAGSFHQWNPLKGAYNFTGIKNYTRVIKSELFWTSLWNTILFSGVVIVFRVVIGLGIALVLFSNIVKYKSFFRTAFYMPVVTPLVAVSFIWVWMYNPQMGLINSIFGTHINWLLNKHTALGSIMAMTIWKDYGYAVVLFLAGLYSLPKDCYEAARIDGANRVQLFFGITLPLLRPMMLFVVITSIISYLQTYIQVLVMTEGGPGTSTFVTSYLIYDEAFVKYNFGFASAISFIMFIVIAILTYLSFKVSGNQGE